MYTANEAAPEFKLQYNILSLSLAANLRFSHFKLHHLYCQITVSETTKLISTGCSGAGGPGVPAGQVRAGHHQLQAQREEQEGKMVGDC